jgi:predicted nucleic acid-binding protein
MKLCLDTNAYSAFKRGEVAVAGILESAEEVLVPAIVLGELHAGFQIGDRAEHNTRELEDFLRRPGVLVVDVDRRVAERYGLLFKALKVIGRPVPTNDLWIAAVAVETGSRVLSDDSHFDLVPGVFRLTGAGEGL